MTYVYFAYDFPEYRNKIAHGDMIFVDKKLAWLKEVDSLALANVQLNLEGAFRKFFREPGVGFPHYKWGLPMVLRKLFLIFQKRQF